MITIQATRAHRFLPLSIQFFMWLFVPMENIRRFYYNLSHCIGKPYLRFQKTYNHWSVIAERDGCILEWEAVWPRVIVSKYKRTHHQIAEWHIESTRLKEKDAVEWLTRQEGKPYGWGDLWWHIVKVFTGKWYGPKGDIKFTCNEVVNKTMKILGYDIPMETNPFELQVILEEPDFTYHADNQTTLFKLIQWILDRSTYIIFGLAGILVIWLTITGQIFKDLEVTHYF